MSNKNEEVINEDKVRYGTLAQRTQEYRDEKKAAEDNAKINANIKVGDKVHLGFGAKGGTGYKGTVKALDGERVHIVGEKGMYGFKEYHGKLAYCTKEEVEISEDVAVGNKISFKHPKTSYGVFGKVHAVDGDFVTAKDNDGELIKLHRTLNKVKKIAEEVEVDEKVSDKITTYDSVNGVKTNTSNGEVGNRILKKQVAQAAKEPITKKQWIVKEGKVTLADVEQSAEDKKLDAEGKDGHDEEGDASDKAADKKLQKKLEKEVDEAADYDSGWKKAKPASVTDKSGAVHTDASRAKDLAQKGKYSKKKDMGGWEGRTDGKKDTNEASEAYLQRLRKLGVDSRNIRHADLPDDDDGMPKAKWNPKTHKYEKGFNRNVSNSSSEPHARDKAEMGLAAHQKNVREDAGEKIYKPGTKIKVPYKGKIVVGKVIRYDSGAGGYSPAYVVDVGAYESLKIPVHQIKGLDEAFGQPTRKEEVDLEEGGIGGLVPFDKDKIAKATKSMEDGLKKSGIKIGKSKTWCSKTNKFVDVKEENDLDEAKGPTKEQQKANDDEWSKVESHWKKIHGKDVQMPSGAAGDQKMRQRAAQDGVVTEDWAKEKAAANRARMKAEKEEVKARQKERLSQVKAHGREPKAIDPSSSAVHKALEKHHGGTFEHYEGEPKHAVHVLPDGRKAAAMHATVTHSYTHKDLGMAPEDMQDTAESYPVTIVRHPEHGLVIHHRLRRNLGEEMELDEAKNPGMFRIDVPQGLKTQAQAAAKKAFGAKSHEASGFSDGSTTWSMVHRNDNKHKSEDDANDAFRKHMGNYQGWCKVKEHHFVDESVEIDEAFDDLADDDAPITRSKNDGKYKAKAFPKGRVVKGSYGSKYKTDEEGNETEEKKAPAVKRPQGRPRKTDTNELGDKSAGKWEFPAGLAAWSTKGLVHGETKNPKAAKMKKAATRKVTFEEFQIDCWKEGFMYKYEVELDENVIATGSAISEQSAYLMAERYVNTVLAMSEDLSEEVEQVNEEIEQEEQEVKARTHSVLRIAKALAHK